MQATNKDDKKKNGDLEKIAPDAERENPEVAHEKNDINFRAVIKFAVWMGVAALFIHGTMWVMFRFYLDSPEEKRPQPPSQLATQATRVPPKPQLQQDPIKDLHNVREAESEMIKKGFTDPKTGANSIPIDQAMEKVLQQGLRSRPEGQYPNEQGPPVDSSAGRKPEGSLR
jgi:hypothetical protein